MATSTSSVSTLLTPHASKAAPQTLIPRLVYGTAWKKSLSNTYVSQALAAGFRGIDTAAQPKHYDEASVCAGIADAIKTQGLRREELYVCHPSSRSPMVPNGS